MELSQLRRPWLGLGVGEVVDVQLAGHNTVDVCVDDLGVVGRVVDVSSGLNQVVKCAVLLALAGGQVDDLSTPHVALRKCLEPELGHNTEVVVATLESLEKAGEGNGVDFKDESGTCDELEYKALASRKPVEHIQ